MRSVVVLLALLVIALPPSLASDPCNLMTTGKNCFCSVRRITCSKTTLPAIPHNFPSDTTVLNIDSNRFAYPVLRRSNISYLTELVSLTLKDCGIEQLQVGVFSDLKKLTFLDLSRNKIKEVPSHTFLSVNLKYLILNQNRGIRLTRDSFEGMQVQRLSLRQCELDEVNYFTFLPLNKSLTGLWLNDNNLRTLDPRFERLGSHLEHFKVDGNPLRCACQMRWLVSYLRRQRSKQSMSLVEESPPVCASPAKLQGKRIRDLQPFQLTCDVPQLRNADVLLGAKRSGQLICRAIGYPTPTIIWYRVYPNRSRLQRFPPLTHFASASRQLNQASIEVHGKSEYEEYVCSASNDGGETNLTVRLNWAKKEPEDNAVMKVNRERPPTRLDHQPAIGSNPVGVGSRPPTREVGLGTNGNKQQRRPNFDEEMTGRDYLFRRQFSLLELIGAVVGTFTSTLGLFVLIYWFINRSKKKEKKRTFSQYMYESAYSGSHEYDVPRLEHAPGPPPPFVAPKPPGPDGMEFLDYKTHRKLYNQV